MTKGHNVDGFAIRDEFAVHKRLNAVGDLALAGCTVHAVAIASYRGGQQAHTHWSWAYHWADRRVRSALMKWGGHAGGPVKHEACRQSGETGWRQAAVFAPWAL